MSISILTDDEREFSINPYSIHWNKRGTIKKRFEKKMNELREIDIKKLSYDLSLIPKDKKESLSYFLLKSIDYKKMRNITKEISKEFNVKEQYIKKRKYVDEILKKSGAKILNNDEKRVFFYPKNLSKLNNPKWVRKTLDKIYVSQNFILYRKINQDIDYILIRKVRRDIWWFIYNNKKMELNKLYEKFYKSKNVIDEYYKRGILLPCGYSMKNFIKLCIRNKDYTKVNDFKYRIYPFKKPTNLNEKVVINPYYKDYKSSPKEIRLLLANLFKGNPEYYPEDYRKNWK